MHMSKRAFHYPDWHAPGNSCNPSYTLEDAAHCSSTDLFITSAQECQWAVQSLLAKDGGAFEVQTTWPSITSASYSPSGCYYSPGSERVYFNEYKGNYDSDDKKSAVCKRGKGNATCYACCVVRSSVFE